MKKAGRPKRSSQYKFRRKSFPFHQYWLMYFTHQYQDASEKDFMCFIKAKSYFLAKSILVLKSKEDYEGVKVKAILGYMLHKDYKNTSNQKKLSIEDWSDIKASSFPNINNFLFKKEIPRPEGYTNRFNKSTAKDCKNIGFKKGSENWSAKHRKNTSRHVSKRKGLIWNGGGWVPWDKEERKKTKNQLINALVLNGDNRKKAAEYLKIGRSTFYKLMLRCEDKAWWDKHHPIVRVPPPRVSSEQRSATQKRVMAKRRADGKPFFDKSSEAESKRIASLQKSLALKRYNFTKSLIPKIKKALSENNNIRSLAAKSLDLKEGTFKAWMQRTSHWVDWKNEYPSSYNQKGSNVTWKSFK